MPSSAAELLLDAERVHDHGNHGSKHFPSEGSDGRKDHNCNRGYIQCSHVSVYCIARLLYRRLGRRPPLVGVASSLSNTRINVYETAGRHRQRANLPSICNESHCGCWLLTATATVLLWLLYLATGACLNADEYYGRRLISGNFDWLQDFKVRGKGRVTPTSLFQDSRGNTILESLSYNYTHSHTIAVRNSRSPKSPAHVTVNQQQSYIIHHGPWAGTGLARTLDWHGAGTHTCRWCWPAVPW